MQIDLTDLINSVSTRAQQLEAQERYDDADALFAEFSEWFVTGSDADQTVITLPLISN